MIRAGFVGKQRFGGPPAQPPPNYRSHPARKGSWTHKHPPPKTEALRNLIFGGHLFRHPYFFHPPPNRFLMKDKISKTDHDKLIKRLESEMKSHSLSQTELGKQLGVTRSYVNKVLSGAVMPSGYFLVQIAKHGLDVGYILTGNGRKSDTLERLEKLEFYVEQLEKNLFRKE